MRQDLTSDWVLDMGNVEKAMLERIVPDDLRAYLLDRGWVQEGEGLRGVSVWFHQLSQERVLVPEIRTFDDYAQRVGDVITAIGTITGMDRESVVLDVELVNSDVLRFRSDEDTGDDASIPLRDGLEFYQGIRGILVAAAKAYREKRPFFSNKHGRFAKEFLQSARLGQTETGSYVVTVLSRLAHRPASGSDSVEEQTLPGVPTVNRMILVTLVESLVAAKAAVTTYRETQDTEAFEESVFKGVSADLCDALIKMTGASGRSKVDVSASWSPVLAPSTELPEIVSFVPTDIPALRIASEELRAASVEPATLVSGWIDTLSRHTEETGPGTVVVVAESGAPPGTKVSTSLTADDYDRAIIIHREGGRVLVSGDLTRSAKRSWLTSARIISSGEQGSFD